MYHEKQMLQMQSNSSLSLKYISFNNIPYTKVHKYILNCFNEMKLQLTPFFGQCIIGIGVPQ